MNASSLTLLNGFIAMLELILLITAYRVTTQRDVPGVIKAYSSQSYILGVTGILTAIAALLNNKTGFVESFFPILLIALLPFALGFSIEQVLARATVYEPGAKTKHALWQLVSDEQKRLAHSIWLEQRHAVSGVAGIAIILLIALPFAIVFLVGVGSGTPSQIGISVSLALHLIGLYNTFLRRDILSQVLGILTMDQGMYLAILKVVNIPAPAILFVVALYFYTIITLIILFLILPRLRQEVDTLSLDKIAEDSRLEG